MRHASVGSAQMLRHIWMRHGHTLDVGLINDGVGFRSVRAAVALPVKVRIDDHGQHRVSQRIFFVAPSARWLGVYLIRKARGIAVEIAFEDSRSEERRVGYRCQTMG